MLAPRQVAGGRRRRRRRPPPPATATANDLWQVAYSQPPSSSIHLHEDDRDRITLPLIKVKLL